MEKIKIKVHNENVRMDKYRIDSMELFKKSGLDENKSKMLEKSIFDNYDDKSMYLNKVNDLYSCLNAGILGNDYLLNAIQMNEIECDQLIYMSPDQLFPSYWEEEIMKHIRNMKDSKNDLVPTTDRYFCTRCNKRQCYTYYRQDRCQDEAATLHIKCCTKGCGKHWVIN